MLHGISHGFDITHEFSEVSYLSVLVISDGLTFQGFFVISCNTSV